MFEFDKVTIDRLSKTDLLAIIQALDYTYEHTKIEQFSSLKESIINDMCKIAGIKGQDELVKQLMN